MSTSQDHTVYVVKQMDVDCKSKIFGVFTDLVEARKYVTKVFRGSIDEQKLQGG